MKDLWKLLMVAAFLATSLLCLAQEEQKGQGGSTERERVKESGEVLKQIMAGAVTMPPEAGKLIEALNSHTNSPTK